MLTDIANILIAIRPFLCSLVYPLANIVYSLTLISFILIWLLINRFPLKTIGPVKYPILLLVISLSISLAFAHNKDNAYQELFNYLAGILLMVFAASIPGDSRNRIIRTIILTAFGVSIFVIYQYFWGLPHLANYLAQKNINNPFTWDYITRQRAFFPFVTPNTLGGYMAMIIPLLLTHDRNWLVLIAICFALLLTKSIGALLSLFVGLGIYFYLKGNLNKRIWLLLGLFLVTITLVFAFRQSALQPHRLVTFSLNRRIIYWQDTINIIRSHAWTGIGMGNFDTTLSRYAHNSYLQIWAEMGILGIISILWLIISIFKSALTDLKNSPYKTQLIGLIAANAVFLLHNTIDLSFFLPEVAFLWWLSLGLLLSQTKNINNN